MPNFLAEQYHGKYRGSSDWVGDLIDAECMVKLEDGSKELDLDSLFKLAKANGIDTAKYKAQRDQPHATGRLRMTIGNALRARARRRHGLFTIEGKRKRLMDAGSIGAPPEPTEKPDGTPIAGAKKTPPKKAGVKKKAPAKKKAATKEGGRKKKAA